MNIADVIKLFDENLTSIEDAINAALERYSQINEELLSKIKKEDNNKDIKFVDFVTQKKALIKNIIKNLSLTQNQCDYLKDMVNDINNNCCKLRRLIEKIFNSLSNINVKKKNFNDIKHDIENLQSEPKVEVYSSDINPKVEPILFQIYQIRKDIDIIIQSFNTQLFEYSAIANENLDLIAKTMDWVHKNFQNDDCFHSNAVSKKINCPIKLFTIFEEQANHIEL